MDIYIDVNSVKDLHSYTVVENSLIVGANVSLNAAIDIFSKVAQDNPNKFGYLKQLATHIDLIANVPVRNVCTRIYR